MAKITAKNIELKDAEKIIFGTDDDAFIEWDETGNQLEVSTVVSGVYPTQSYQLTTRNYVDAKAFGNSNGLISGGATWDTGLIFDVSALEYVINGNIYTSAGGIVTLNTADPSLDRIDIIYANISGAVGVLTGTPSANPLKPNLDESTQVEVSFVTIPAGATQPAGVSVISIYMEDAGTPSEWAAVSNSGNINKASTNNPFSGTKDIEGTAADTNNSVTLTASTPVSFSTVDSLELHIRSKAAWNNRKYMSLQFYNGSTPIGYRAYILDGYNGFVSSNTTTYQTISIPKTSFGISSQSVDKLVVLINNYYGGAGVGFYLDQIRLQLGVPIYSPGMKWTQIRANTGTLSAQSSADTLTVSGSSGISTSIVSSKLVISGDHGGLAGLSDDDHSQYILANGTRAFSSTVSGVTPTQNQHLATKYYVDTAVSGVTTIFGSNYFVAEDVTQTDTTNTSYVRKLRLTASGAQAGNYRIDYYSEWLHSKTSTTFGYKVDVDDATIIHETSFAPANALSWYTISGFDYYTLASGTHTFDIEFLSSSTGSTSSIKNARIEVWRIS